MIKVILWDVDGTLLDFGVAEKVAIRQCFASHNMGECIRIRRMKLQESAKHVSGRFL